MTLTLLSQQPPYVIHCVGVRWKEIILFQRVWTELMIESAFKRFFFVARSFMFTVNKK